MTLIPSQAAGRRLFVKNISSNNIVLFSGVQLVPEEEVDVFVEDPSITDARALDDMQNPVGSLYIETTINNTVRIIDFDTTDFEAPDIVRGHQGRVVFSRPKEEQGGGASTTPGNLPPVEGTDFWVDPVAGNDFTGNGTEDNPWKTIQHAINVIVGPIPRYWELGEDKTIHVKYTEGMDPIREHIVKPAHAGEGALVIQAEAEIVHTGLTSGSFSAIAGYEVRHQLALTAAGLTPNTLQDDAFVKLQDESSVPSISDASFETFPIVDNGANSLDVVAVDPGVRTGFYHAPAALLDVTRAQVPWKGADTAAFLYANGCMFTNLGGPAYIKDFDIEAGDAQVKPQLCNDLGHGDVYTSPGTSFVRCNIHGFWNAAVGPGPIQFAACLFDYPTPGGILVVSSKNVDIVNCRMHTNYNAIQTRSVDNALFNGFDCNATISFFNNTRGSIYADVRSGRVTVTTHSYAAIPALTVESAGGAGAIQSLNHGSVYMQDGSRIHGSTGNNDVGLEIGDLSKAQVSTNPGSATLTGTNGNVKVGAKAAQNWGAGADYDATTFSIYTE